MTCGRESSGSKMMSFPPKQGRPNNNQTDPDQTGGYLMGRRTKERQTGRNEEDYNDDSGGSLEDEHSMYVFVIIQKSRHGST